MSSQDQEARRQRAADAEQRRLTRHAVSAAETFNAITAIVAVVAVIVAFVAGGRSVPCEPFDDCGFAVLPAIVWAVGAAAVWAVLWAAANAWHAYVAWRTN